MSFVIPARIVKKLNTQSVCGICGLEYAQENLLRHCIWHISRGDVTLTETSTDDTSI